MNSKALLASLTLLCLLTHGLAQQPSRPAADQDKDDVVRITTNLVQIDAVVTKDRRKGDSLASRDLLDRVTRARISSMGRQE